MLLVPAVLTNNVIELDGLLREILQAKKFERVQIDFIDGSFANNWTIKPLEVDLIPYFPIQFDAHLMVTEDNVLIWEKTAWKMGFKTVTVQIESVSTPEDYKGLSLDIHSPIKLLEPHLPKLTMVNLMAVEPGFGGQTFDMEVVAKVKELVNIRKQKNLRFQICVDGGVEQEHLPMLEAAGADMVAVGAKRVLTWNNA